MATTETFAPDRLHAMPLAGLQLGPNQPRKYLDAAALGGNYTKKENRIVNQAGLKLT